MEFWARRAREWLSAVENEDLFLQLAEAWQQMGLDTKHLQSYTKKNSEYVEQERNLVPVSLDEVEDRISAWI